MKLSYKIALFCGLAPLIAGMLILLGCITSEADIFIVAGLFNIFIGLVLFVIGVISLGFYIKETKPFSANGKLKSVIIAMLLLLVNFPAAAACVYAVIYIKTSSLIQVDNQSAIPISDVRLEYGEHSMPLDKFNKNTIMPYSKYKKRLKFKREGSVNYSFYIEDQYQEGVLLGYVTPNFGSKATILISDKGEVDIISE